MGGEEHSTLQDEVDLKPKGQVPERGARTADSQLRGLVSRASLQGASGSWVCGRYIPMFSGFCVSESG